MNRFIVAIFCFVAYASSVAYACGIEGTSSHRSGTQRHDDSTISTSWNGKTTIPMSGCYELELGSNAYGEKITAFAKSMTQAEVRLPKSGNARVDLVYDDSGYRR